MVMNEIATSQRHRGFFNPVWKSARDRYSKLLNSFSLFRIVREAGMLGIKFARLIEKHSESLGKALVDKLRSSSRTDSYRSISEHELLHDIQVLYHNLSDWLMVRTELDVKQYYTKMGLFRAEQGVPMNQFIWALVLAKEQLWLFMQREALIEDALELMNELEFVLALEQFFDRAMYYVAMSYTQGKKSAAA